VAAEEARDSPSVEDLGELPGNAKPASRYLMTARGYLHPQRTYFWITLLIIGVMSLLYYVVGLGPNAQGSIPPAFNFGASDLYFHSIAIGIAALGVNLVVMTFDLEKYEPAIDFPLTYRALLANVFGAIGAAFYLRPVFTSEFAPLGLGLILLGLILLADVGGALLVELYLLPGKLSGIYDPSQNILGMIPKWRHLPSWKDFRKMDSTYWLTFVTVFSAFVAGVIGFVVFWMNYFVLDIAVSPSIFNGYIAWLGGPGAVLGTTMGSHSHMIVMALMLGVVAVVAKRFRVLSLTGWQRRMAKVGLWVSITGVAAFTVVFILESFTTVFPGGVPGTLFGSNPGGSLQLFSSTGSAANGMAGDDTTMLWAALGSLIVLIPLLYTKLHGVPAWKDPVRAAILGTWILAFIATPLQGFYIEFNESNLGGAPPDLVFGNLQYFALIGITLVCMALLTVDFYVDQRQVRTPLAAFAIFSILIATVGGFIYVFYTTASGSVGYWIFNAGFVLMDLVLIGAMAAVYSGQQKKLPGNGVSVPAPEVVSPAPVHEPEKAPS
jgi:hypothetical protein